MQQLRFPIVRLNGSTGLLEAAIKAYQPQWRDEKPVIWSNGHIKAFLRHNHNDGTVTLHITGHSGNAIIFVISREGWIVHPKAEMYYEHFVNGVKLPTVRDAKSLVKQYLTDNNIPFSRIAGKTVSFSDLSRCSQVFVFIYGWKPGPSAADLKKLASENGFYIEFKQRR